MVTYISIPFTFSDGAAQYVAIHCLISKNLQKAFKNSSSIELESSSLEHPHMIMIHDTYLRDFQNSAEAICHFSLEITRVLFFFLE